jgi:hypothetical protein
LENDWEDSENIGRTEYSDGMRERMVARLRLGHVQLHLGFITSPADEADFDNAGGTMPLTGSSDVDSSAFPKSSASSTVKPNPTPISGKGTAPIEPVQPL